MKLLFRFAFIFTFFVLSIQDTTANINSLFFINNTNSNSSFLLENTSPPSLGTVSGPTNVCLNSTNQVVTFTGSGGTAPYTFTYTINGVLNLTISSLGTSDFVTLNIPTSTSGPITYTLVSIHDSVAPTVEIPQTNVLHTVTILDLPVVDFTFVNNQCSGSSVAFNSTATGTGPFTYAWDFGDGGTSTLSDPTHVFNASFGNGIDNFSVTLVIINTTTNCENSITKTVSVKQLPDSAFDLNQNNGASLYDLTQGIFLNCGATNSSPNFMFVAVNASSTISSNTNYSINWGDGNIDNLTSSFLVLNHTYTALGFFNILLTTSNSTSGCISSKTYRLFNGNSPAGNLDLLGNANDCVPYTFSWPVQNTSNNPPGTTYQFSINDGSPVQNFTQANLPSSITHRFNRSSCGLGLPNNKFTISFNVQNPCGDNPQTSTIQSSQKPIASFLINSNLYYCTNNNITFTNTSIGNYFVGNSCSTTFNKNWTITPSTGWVVTSGVMLNGSDVISVRFTTAGNYSISLNVRKPGTTDSTAARCTDDTKSQTICIDAPLLPLFTLNNTESCTPAVITTTNTTDITKSCNPPTYLWNIQYANDYCGSTPPTWSYTSGSSTTANPSFSFVTPGTYSIKVTMTNSCGAVTSAIQTVIVKKPPTVAITAIPNLCQTAGNTTISPTAVVDGCAPSASALTYLWSFPGGIPATSNSATPGPITYSGLGTYTVSLSVTNECGATVATNKTFTINSLPTISGTLSACVGQTATLSGSPSPATTSPWASSTPAIATISTSGVVTGVSAGTTTITYTNSFGCQTTASFTVNTVPTASITGNASVCLNSNSSTITFTGANGIAPYIFTYSINNGLPQTISTISGNSIVLPAITSSIGVFNYCLLSVKDSSLSQCIKTYSNTCVTIIVSALPTIVTQPLTSQTICVGGTIAPLTVSYINGLGTATYKWYSNTTATNTGGTLITGATTASYTPPAFSTAGTYYYYAVVTLSGTGCGIATSQPATVIVVADPIVSVQPLATQTQCQSNAATQLSVTATGGTGTFTYQWYSNAANNTTSGTIIATATSDTYTPLIATVGTVYYYCIIGQIGLGCNVTSATAVVIVVPAPTINLQPLPSSVCQNGTPTTLSVTYINGTGTASYQWFSNTTNTTASGTSLGSTATNSTYIPSTATVGTVYYYCIITLSSGGCTSITSNIASVVVTTLPTIATQPLTSQTICVGGTIAPLTVSYIDGLGTATYKWYTNTTATNTGGTVIAGATSISYTPPSFSTAGTYYYYAVVTLSGTGCGIATSLPATVIVVADPIVSVQPLATQTQCQSNAATQLSVSATGGTGNFTYQWYSNTANNTASGTSIGITATNDTYTPSTATVATVYYYCVIGQSGLGCNVTSATAAVIVVAAPTISLQPQPSTVCQNGTPTTLSVTYINGTGTASYQWYSNVNNDITSGTSLGTTATSNTYIPSTATVGTVYYYCIITLSSGGCTSITSNIASVVVTTLPTIATQPLTSQTICVGGTIAPLTVSYIDGLGTAAYKWYTNTTATNTGGTVIAGATSTSYTPPSFSTAGTYYYYAVVTLSGTGCGVATSLPATVIVVADPIVSVQPLATQTQCQSNAATQLSVSATGGTENFTYQWYSNITNNSTSGTIIATATSDTYTPSTATVGTVYYYCIIGQTGLGCNATSATAAVIVVPAPTINLQPQPSSVCQNGTPTTLSVTYINGTGTASYQWFSNTIDSTISGTPVGTNSPSYLPQSTSFGATYYYCIISLSSGGCTSITTNTALVTVNANPIVTTAQTQTVCSNSPFSISPTDGSGNVVPSGTTYSWGAPVVTGNMTLGVIGLDQITINGTLINPTITSQTAIYTVTPSANGCSGTSFPITVTVNPTPVIAAVTPAAICSGISFSVTPINSGTTIVPTGTTYTWTVGVNSNITGQSASTTTGITTISQTLTNLVNTSQSLIYTVTPTSGDTGNCVGTPFTITVTVSPKPTIADVTSAAICSGTLFSVTPSNSGATIVPTGTTYTWTTPVSTPIGAITGGIAQPTGQGSIGQLLSNGTNDIGTLDYTVTPTSGSCQGIPFHIIVTVNPIPGTLSLMNLSYCNGVLTAPIVFSNAVTGTTYAWTNSNPLIGLTPTSGVADIPAFSATNGGATAITTTLSVIATANGCSRVAETFTITVNPSPAVTFTPTNQSICSGDSSALVTLGSASAGATYSWTAVQPTGISGVTLLGTNSIPVQTLTNSTNAAIVVTYSATATIAGGATCAGAVYDYTITVKPKPAIENQAITICNNQNFSIDPLNGIPSVLTIVPIGTLYAWTIIQNPNITGASDNSGALISQTLTNLSDTLQSIVYNVTPSYLNCNGNSFTITVNVNPTPNVIFSIPNQIICNNTQNAPINLNSNAVGTINYSWICNNPPPISELTGLILSGTTSTIPTQLLVNNSLIPIVISYVVSAEILGSVICQGPPLIYTITVNPTIITSSILTNYNSYNVSYFGGSDGAIDLTVSGGSGIYTYNWTGPNSFISTSQDISNLVAGNYTVIINDGYCNPITLNFTLTQPPELLIQETIAAHYNLLCFGDSNGTLGVTITQESVAPYDYQLLNSSGVVISFINNTNSLSHVFNTISAGIFSIKVIDANGGVKTISGLTLSQPNDIVITAATTPITCYGGNDASIILTVTGGTFPYTGSWDNLATGLSQNNLSAGTYTIVITDANNCSKPITVIIPEAPIFTVNPVVSNISCFGANDGSINLNFIGGIAPVVLTWSDGSTAGTTRNNLGPGTYSVIIRDSKPCYINKTFIIVEPQLLVLASNITNALDCNNANSGSINLMVSGGNPPFTYLWSNGATTEDLANVVAGNYSVIVRDFKGCTKSAQYVISRPPPIVLGVQTNTDFNCVTKIVKQTFVAQASGGVPSYSYNWSSGTVSGVNNQIMNTSINGMILLQATDAIGCSTNYTFNVDIPTLGDISFNSNSYAFATYGSYSINDPIQFTNIASGDFISVNWSFGDGTYSTDLNPIHQYVSTGTYIITQTVTYPFGCVYNNVTSMIIGEGYALVIPNAFTPNNDALNAFFQPEYKGLSDFSLDVYDTWGELIYSEKGDAIRGWDGKVKGQDSENGNYYYKVSGKTFYGKIIEKQASFVLIK